MQAVSSVECTLAASVQCAIPGSSRPAAHLSECTSTARGPRPSGCVTVNARESSSSEEGRDLQRVGWRCDAKRTLAQAPRTVEAMQRPSLCWGQTCR